MKKRNKSYKQRWIAYPLAYQTAITGASLLSLDDVLVMADKPKMSVDEISQGRATDQSWQDLFDSVNLLEALVKFNYASDPHGIVSSTQDVIAGIIDRRKSTSALRASELSLLRDFCAAYAEVLGSVTNQELYEAYDYVVRSIGQVKREGTRLDSGLIIKKAQ